LDEIRTSEEFERAVTRAATVVDNVGVVNAFTGQALGETMARFQAVSEELV
jgi:hypothetical protein